MSAAKAHKDQKGSPSIVIICSIFIFHLVIERYNQLEIGYEEHFT
jgi:hypothetical protein